MASQESKGQCFELPVCDSYAHYAHMLSWELSWPLTRISTRILQIDTLALDSDRNLRILVHASFLHAD